MEGLHEGGGATEGWGGEVADQYMVRHVWSWVRMTDNPKKKKFKIIYFFLLPPPPEMFAFGSLSLHNVMVVSAAQLPPARGTGDEVLRDACLYILLNPSRTSYLLF